MKPTTSIVATVIFALCSATFVNAQSSSPRPKSQSEPPAKAAGSPSSPGTSSISLAGTTAPAPVTASATRTDVYHVHFTKAAPGKSIQLGDNLKTPDPKDPMAGHAIVFRHQEGDAWDYAVIQHMGTSATVDAARPAPSPGVRDLSDWHTDTYVSGPAWADFAKAMGIDESNKGKSAGSVYVVSVYRPAPGHRDQLEKMLGEPPGSGETAVGNVLLQHLEGGPWTYLSVARYNSWQDFGTNEANSVASSSKNEGGWFQLREHVSFHTDTLANRIFP